MKNLIQLAVIFASIILLQGCSSQPNCSAFVKGQMLLMGYYSPQKPLDVSYDDGIIRDMNGIDQMPDVAIELPCGNVLLSEITPELLIAQASGYSRIYPPEYKSYVDPILFDSYSVHIDNREGQLMYGFIVSHQKILRVEFIYHAVLWDRKNIKRYIFPITYDQAVELFGEPDKAYNYHRVRL